MNDANANMPEGPAKDGASCFGVMTGCFTLAFLSFSVLTFVALGKRWIDPSGTPSTSFSYAEEPPPAPTAPISNPPVLSGRTGLVRIKADVKPPQGRVRSGPGKHNSIIGNLPDGVLVEILEESLVTDIASDPGIWYKVRGTWRRKQVVGWMHSDIVKTE
jgi:hypothetical protein